MEKSMKAVVFVHGDRTDLSRIRTYIDDKTLLVACDGGAVHALQLGYMPHVVIGDFDSLPPKVLRALKDKHVECISFPRNKSHSDGELGVALAIERGCREVVIVGFQGTHTDHVIGNLFLLANKKFTSASLKIIEGNEEIVLVRKRVTIRGKHNDMVSLIPFGGHAVGITTRGLLYSLHKETLYIGSTRGLRNHLTHTQATVAVDKGSLLMVHRFA